MPRPTASPDLITSHYTRVSGTGEAANRASKETSWEAPDAATQTKEIIMYRMFTTAAVLALTVTVAQAETSDHLAVRIHDAAVAACAPERASAAPRSHYGVINDQCVYRISKSAMTKYQDQAKAAENSKFANK